MKFIILTALLSILTLGCGPTYQPRGEEECKKYCKDTGHLNGLYMGNYCTCIDRYLDENLEVYQDQKEDWSWYLQETTEETE